MSLVKKLQDKEIRLIPGKKVCRKCFTRLQKLPDGSSSSVSETDSTSTIASTGEGTSTATDLSAMELSSSLSQIGQSPVKLHSVSRKKRSQYGKRKLSSINREISKRLAVALDVPEEEVTYEKSVEQKVQDFDGLMEKVKAKINEVGTTRSEKIQLLTIVPESRSRKSIMEYFEVTKYMAKASQSLVASNRIFSKPPPRKGKALSSEIKNIIIDFYKDNENTRIMPGARDKVSIAPNVYKQKRLILCTLKELYLSFKAKYPDTKVGFSTFATIRPKWCVLAGSAGTHAACVCTIHQNAILMLKSAQIEDSYQDLISMMVCDPDNKECMLQQCTDCPGR